MNALRFIIAVTLMTAFSVSLAESLKERRFALSIERGALASVLAQLSQQTGLDIGTEISVASSPITTLGPFAAHATADEALRQLLKDTDLWHVWRDEETVRLFLVSAQRKHWRTERSTAKEASDSIQSLAGVRYETGGCDAFSVGPFVAEAPVNAEEFWVELIKPHCPVIRKPSADIKPGSFDRPALEGDIEHTFSIPARSRYASLQRIARQSGVKVRYVSSDAQEELAIVAPVAGRLSLNDALRIAMRDSVLRARWVADDIVSIEPAYTMVSYANMSACRCNFGLPELSPLQSADVTVTQSRLPSLQEYSPVPPARLDRAMIEATGASSIPELLNHFAPQAFNFSRGYRANAAQYFEGRGFGAQYSLVLIDGHRAYGSAGDPLTNAFDLNVVPLSAVERLDVALDQPSVLSGTDAIGGTVNIVLRRDFSRPAATLSLGSTRGGAQKSAASLVADAPWGETTAGFVVDHLRRSDLLGSERDRWRNQDFTRYPGGLDYRLPVGVPPNVHAISGNLPGTDANSAAIVMEPDGPALRPNETNTVSALSLAAVVPEQERSSVYGFASTALGSAQLHLSGLAGRQATSLRLIPVDLSGLIWGAHHPQNPFDTDVVIEALLTGLPPRTQEVESLLKRVAMDLSGSFGGWNYSLYAVSQENLSRAWLINDIDQSALAQSLMTEDPSAALNVLSARPGEGPLPAGFFLPRRVDASVTEGDQFGLDLSGRLPASPAGDAQVDVGFAQRQEAVDFDAMVGRKERQVGSIFSLVRIPLVSASATSVLRGLQLGIGGRRDLLSDVRDVTTWQYSLSSQPHPWITIRAGYSDLFRPPSLSELNLPRFSLPIALFDPQRNETTGAIFVGGGTPSLHPSEGRSVDVHFSFDPTQGWRAQLNFWQTQIRDRISTVLLQDLLNVQANDVNGRIVRAEPTAADLAAHRPGRILSVDSTRANFGAIEARGIDLSIAGKLETRLGRLTPRIGITRTLSFRYRDLPAAAAPMLDRAGVASLYGTVPSACAVASVQLDVAGLRAAAFARHHTSYQDFSIVRGAATNHRIRAQTLLDIKVTKSFGDHWTLSVGANNVFDDRPPFAQSGGWEGFDQSQGDLVGREAYVDVSSSF